MTCMTRLCHVIWIQALFAPSPSVLPPPCAKNTVIDCRFWHYLTVKLKGTTGCGTPQRNTWSPIPCDSLRGVRINRLTWYGRIDLPRFQWVVDILRTKQVTSLRRTHRKTSPPVRSKFLSNISGLMHMTRPLSGNTIPTLQHNNIYYALVIITTNFVTQYNTHNRNIYFSQQCPRVFVIPPYLWTIVVVIITYYQLTSYCVSFLAMEGLVRRQVRLHVRWCIRIRSPVKVHESVIRLVEVRSC